MYTRRQKYADPNHGANSMEDFFSAQGYSRDEKRTWRQKIKNNYIEFKYGMKYYNFFDWQEWRRILLRFVISMGFVGVFVILFQKMTGKKHLLKSNLFENRHRRKFSSYFPPSFEF